MLASVSRLVGEVQSPELRGAAGDVRRLMAAFREKEDLIAIGAYQRGTDPVTDAAIDLRPAIDAFLRQRVEEPSSLAEADDGVMAISAAQARLVEQAAAAQPAQLPGPAAAQGRPPASGGVPLHSAIPPLHLHA